MKRNLLNLVLLALSWLVCMPIAARKDHLLPVPKKMTAKTGVTLQLSEGAAITVTGIAGNPTLERFFKEFGASKVSFNASGQSGTVHVTMVSDLAGTVDHKVPLYPNEAYKLEVNGSDIQITAVTESPIINESTKVVIMDEYMFINIKLNLFYSSYLLANHLTERI